ncbi:MAG: 3'-5' exonuclease, partial [Oscillospiraceae bacterium]
WLKSMRECYGEITEIAETPWAKTLLVYLGEMLSFCRYLTQDSIRALRQDEKLNSSLGHIFEDDLAKIENLIAKTQEADWDHVSELLSGVSFGRMPSIHGYEDDPLKNRVMDSRKLVKKSLKSLELYFCDTEAECRDEISRMLPIISGLTQMVEAFSTRYSEKKKEKKLADYGDLEHWTMQLLLMEEGETLLFTPLALELSSRFDEIMIDEYQDTNEVQDCIFRALSKSDSNKFMVGDVKQCIYSFRQAMPDIFIDYKESFARYDAKKDQYPATIVLDKNYRSRNTVIESVNYVFSQLMSKSAGGIDYVGDEALALGADYPIRDGYETRVDFLEKTTDIPQELAEARHIAECIRETIDSGLLISDHGEERPATYRDFCVLLRTANKYASAYAKEMERLSVPAWAAVAKGFFASTEVSQVLSFLQVIDNPNQDIPLLSVLFGPVYGFSADTLGELRLGKRERSIYVSILEDTTGKFRKLLTDLEQYRLLAAVLPSDAFMDYFYTITGYTDLVLAMENGESRRANLRLLQKYARDYESAGYIGISGFVRFMEKLRHSKSDMESANLISENANVVRVMSIHKSKGLEFPVCIVAGCGRKINFENTDVVLNSQMGLGIKLKDQNTGAKFTNIVRDAVSLANRMELVSEELRILYVAMTRAKEKLFMISSVKSIDSLLARLASQLSGTEAAQAYTVKSVTSMTEWLLLCAIRHPNGKYLRDKIGTTDDFVVRKHFTPWDIRVIAPQEDRTAKMTEETVHPLPDPALVQSLREKMDFHYLGTELNAIPAKVTASALSESKSERVQTLPRPAFLSAHGLTPAERGTALHSFMQFCNFKEAGINPQKERDRLVAEGFITAEEGKVIPMEKVLSFLHSSIGHRMTKASVLLKEQRFTVNIPARLVDANLPAEFSETPVILQGAVDCAFIENNKLYIVDFKTDRIDEAAELVAAYGVQLMLYARALEQVMGLPIGACYLYSLHINQAILVE